MKILLVTEKSSPELSQRDGGFRLIQTLKEIFKGNITIMQFANHRSSEKLSFIYPYPHSDRFIRRLLNADFIQEQVKKVENDYTHIFYIHVSMQFGIIKNPLERKKIVWTFPMFLTPSYRMSGEKVPSSYFEREKEALSYSNYILTPSPLEQKQLMEIYKINNSKIRMVPRGVSVSTSRCNSELKNPIFCHIGSIKPQKNTLKLIELYSAIKKIYSCSQLKIIGPVQNLDYKKLVLTAIKDSGLNESISFLDYLTPKKLFQEIEKCHIHLSASNIETFGRSIFESLAKGLPNILFSKSNAAQDFLKYKPYVSCVSNFTEALNSISFFLENFKTISNLAQEIGFLFDERRLQNLLDATLQEKESLILSDFDGTLFHKHDIHKTRKSIQIFNKFNTRVLCSARTKEDLIEQCFMIGLKPHWLISYGGGLISKYNGDDIWVNRFYKEDLRILHPYVQNILFYKGLPLQIDVKNDPKNVPFYFRKEVYQNIHYLMPFQSNKLYASLKLIDYLEWKGQIEVFGDGLYDEEIITYFNGKKVCKDPKYYQEVKEITHDLL